jgi:hypothetical protein
VLICLDVAVILRQAEHVDHIFAVEEARLLLPEVWAAPRDREMVLRCWRQGDQELTCYHKPGHGFADARAILTLRRWI